MSYMIVHENGEVTTRGHGEDQKPPAVENTPDTFTPNPEPSETEVGD